VTANEGDARNAEGRTEDLTLDPSFDPALQDVENLGRREVSPFDGAAVDELLGQAADDFAIRLVDQIIGEGCLFARFSAVGVRKRRPRRYSRKGTRGQLTFKAHAAFFPGGEPTCRQQTSRDGPYNIGNRPPRVAFHLA